MGMLMQLVFLVVGIPLLMFLSSIIGWGIVHFAYNLSERKEYKKHRKLLFTGLMEILFGLLAHSFGCESKHVVFGPCFEVPSWVGNMAIVCGICTILCAVYLISKDKQDSTEKNS
jgi:hypothetical protein